MKQLNVNGSEILTYRLDVVVRNQNNHNYEDLFVEIITSEDSKEHSYQYTMHSDERVPTVDWLKQALKERLDAAKNDYLSFKIKEDSVRSYLLIQVGGKRFGTLQVTGRRLK
tara:strand:- start:1050 stop:1385 length:336 start_codon:yes stop_codon:yes gene_type:complete